MAMDLTSSTPVTPLSILGGGGGGGSEGFGGSWMAFLILIVLLGGFGGNGFGFGGNRGAGIGAIDNTLQTAFDYNSLNNGLRGMETNISDLRYASCNQENATRDTILNSSFAVREGIAGINSQMAYNNCQTNRNIDALRYDCAKSTCEIMTNQNMNTRDLIDAGTANTQRIIDLMQQNTIQELREKNTALTLQLAEKTQTQNIINALKPTPSPAYVVSNPLVG